MYCEHCGKELHDGAKFCHVCGTPVKTAVQPIENAPGGKRTPVADKKTMAIIAVLAVIILCCLGYLGYLIYDSRTPAGGGDTGTSEAESEEKPEPRMQVLVTDGINEKPLSGVGVQLFGSGASTAVDQATSDSDGKVLFEDMADGEYTLKFNCSGYYDEESTILVQDGYCECRQVMIGKIRGDEAYVVLSWPDSRDLDLAVYNDFTEEYLRSFDDKDELGNVFLGDNDGSVGYEIARLASWDTMFRQTVYVLDSSVTESDDEDTSVPDYKISIYTSDGCIYQKSQSEVAEASYYSPGYFENGSFVDEAVAESGKDNDPWVHVDKRDAGSIDEYRAERLKAMIEQRTRLNNSSELKIDLEADNYDPEVRNKNYAWDKSLFYSLEDVDTSDPKDGLIYGYKIVRRRLINTKSNNYVDYEIYINPDTNLINKIISIEYEGEVLHITDFYYDDDQKVSFIFSRYDINYTPSYAKPTIDGYRYYFNNDTMIRLRTVEDGKMTNFCIGEPTADGVRNPIMYDDLSAEYQAMFDGEEARWLNIAYNTLHAMYDGEGTCYIEGYIYDENERARNNVNVDLYYGEYLVSSTKTDSEGRYVFYAPMEDCSYVIKIDKDTGFTPVTMYDVETFASELQAYMDTVWLAGGDNSTYSVTLNVTDALNYASDGRNMASVSGAKLSVREGMNNKTGNVIVTLTSDSYGFAYADLKPGMYTLEIEKSGYDKFYLNFCVNRYQLVVYASASPKLDNGEIRIVLTWGNDPPDLDSHLFTPYDGSCGTDAANYHVWYSNKWIPSGDNLDVDDTDWFGPETVTISSVRQGYYKYYVVDYTNSSQGFSDSEQMSRSGATVRVYTSRGLVATWHVPTDRRGVIWEVFEIRNGMITPINRYYTNLSDSGWWEHY